MQAKRPSEKPISDGLEPRAWQSHTPYIMQATLASKRSSVGRALMPDKHGAQTGERRA
ncbi:hypothetical protein HMPREF9120_01426 [Neisseria sp. oral taxon 020 str. F0370]|nr:hypothetical protein HMPREF9120_01426 [Neisseria sp. oral taxon 020 str. F0370]